MSLELTGEQLTKLAQRIARELRGQETEPHYSAARAAELLEVTERTVWNYVDAYERSGGKEGLGPTVKLSHKVVRIPASALNRFLAARTVVAAPAQAEDAAA